MLLPTLPKIQVYQNIIDNITGSTEDPSYAKVVLRLRELSDWTFKKTDVSAEVATAFVTEQKVRCQYCKSKGWPRTSHE